MTETSPTSARLQLLFIAAVFFVPLLVAAVLYYSGNLLPPTGKTNNGVDGVINNELVKPIYWDVNIAALTSFVEDIPIGHNAFIYLIEGAITIGNDDATVQEGQLAVLEDGAELLIKSSVKSRFLVVGGKPINEPVERGGPFVMNTRQEIHQAFADYQAGNLVTPV